MTVTKGLSTWAGLAAALAQYLGAVAVFLEADDQAVALGPLATATATLVAVIAGRMMQAKAVIENAPAQRKPPAVPSEREISTWAAPGQNLSFTTQTGTGFSEATATFSRRLGEPEDLSQEVPAGSEIRRGDLPS